VLVHELTAVLTARVGTALPELMEISRNNELLHLPFRPAHLEAPEYWINLLHKQTHIYTRMCLSGNQTNIMVVGASVLGVTVYLPSEPACSGG
jgi:hypothetical protein